MLKTLDKNRGQKIRIQSQLLGVTGGWDIDSLLRLKFTNRFNLTQPNMFNYYSLFDVYQFLLFT